MGRSRLSMFILTGILVLLTLSGCGPKTTQLDIELSEFEFNPNAFTVKAGEQVNLNLKNNGALEHNFVILKAGYEATAPFDRKNKAMIYFEQKVPANKSISASFRAPKEAGIYEIICSIPGHLEQNMKGTLTVSE